MIDKPFLEQRAQEFVSALRPMVCAVKLEKVQIMDGENCLATSADSTLAWLEAAKVVADRAIG